jgi:hypothetical protein
MNFRFRQFWDGLNNDLEEFTMFSAPPMGWNMRHEQNTFVPGMWPMGFVSSS